MSASSRRVSRREERAPLPLGERELLDATDVGLLLGCHRSSVHQLFKDGELPEPMRLGAGQVKWRRRELVDWVCAGCPPRDAWQWQPSVEVGLTEYVELLTRRARSLNEELGLTRALAAKGETTVRVRR